MGLISSINIFILPVLTSFLCDIILLMLGEIPLAQTEVSIPGKEQKLMEKFLQGAEIFNFESKYIKVPAVNRQIDPQMQGLAADLIVEYYNRRQLVFDKVIGIPNSGISLASVVAGKLPYKTILSVGRKGNDVPTSWEDRTVISGIRSYTTGEATQITLDSIREGDRILLIDDVIAHGETGGKIAKVLKEKHCAVEFSAYFAKLFQSGVDVLRDYGIEPFYAIGIQRLYVDGDIPKIELAPPHFS